MGFLYVKVIESKKVAVKNSFFVNYPFIRVVVGKEKKTTNFKPGVEWWDKILAFKAVPKGEHQQIIIQARDKSIHVFGSDWLGEVKLDLDTEGLMDGRVHQTWYKFGRGRKAHSRSPRGYIHLAFQYTEDSLDGKRPFSVAPVEKVLTFEEWLAANNSSWSAENVNTVATEPGWKVPEPSSSQNPMLRRSAPALDETRSRSKSVSNQDNVDNSLNDPNRERKVSWSSRERSQTMPDVRSPSIARKTLDRSSSGEEDCESDEEPKLGNLIDFSFDAPKDKMKGHSSANTSMPTEPVNTSPRSLDDKIEQIRKLSLSTEVTTHPEASEIHKSSSTPTFAEWYVAPDGSKVQNPFLSMHDNFEPSSSTQS